MRAFDDISAAFASYKGPIAFAVCIACGLFALRKYFAGGVCHSKARLDGKTVLITGANTGIGKETAKDLTKRGARVLMACRDKTRAEHAAEEVRRYSGSQDVQVYILDLASLASVRKCAEEVKSKEKRLDVLINNAGLFGCPYSKTEDGFELQFATNHLGHFLFTNLLLDLLKASAPSRIVNVSSGAYSSGRINFDDINSESNYGRMTSYRQSKLANVLFTRELSRRLEDTGVTVNVLHPGLVHTPIQRHVLPDGSLLTFIVEALYVAGLWFFVKDPAQGAQTSIFCAVVPELEGVTGEYFCDCAVEQLVPHAKDDETAAKLWSLSEKMVGLIK